MVEDEPRDSSAEDGSSPAEDGSSPVEDGSSSAEDGPASAEDEPASAEDRAAVENGAASGDDRWPNPYGSMGPELFELPRPSRDLLERLFRSNRTNAILSWFLVVLLGITFIESVLDVDWQWIVFVTVTGVVALLPPVTARNWRVMLPWELLGLALLPILVRALFGGPIGTFGYYLAVATLALLITVELHTYTDLQVTHWFAVALVVMTTMASAAAWTIVRHSFDLLFDTSYLSTNRALMIEFVWVTLAGFTAGLLFDAYFRRRRHLLGRVFRWVIDR